MKRILSRHHMLVACCLILVYFIIAIAKIDRPGIHYDEILFGNAALGGLDNVFMTAKLGKFPLLLMPYIGALKAYLYYPIFHFFGVSVLTIRFPAILLTAGSLYLLFLTVKRTFGSWAGLMVLGLLAIDASFIAQTRTDFGPVVIEFFLKALSLLLLEALVRTRQLWYLAGIFFVFALGEFNKLNFVWFINSFSVSGLVVFRHQIWNFYQNAKFSKKSFALSVIVGAIAGYLLLVWYFFRISTVFRLLGGTPVDLASRFITVGTKYYHLITGYGFYTDVFGTNDMILVPGYFFIVHLAIAAGIWFGFYGRYAFSTEHRTYYLFYLLLFAGILIQVLLTGKATETWHVFMIYPMLQILFGVSLIQLYKGIRSFQVRWVLLLVCFAFILSYGIIANISYLRAYDHPPQNIYWSEMIFQLAERTVTTSERYVSIDWGTHTQLVTLTQVRGKYIETSNWLKKELPLPRQDYFYQKYLQPDGYVFILHPAEKTFFPKARENLFMIARQHDIQLDLFQQIQDQNGQVIFELYRKK